ncbi:hypothetical protein [Sinomonas gamaensis]|uniref:hypothetical protein n=1 Tax=Sinomonas gamaensis TaxID=2565624 RepID=UPI001486441C|nr:hypothetical protein [Sinomonas gamaensis]
MAAVPSPPALVSAIFVFLGQSRRELKHYWREKRYESYVELLMDVEPRMKELALATRRRNSGINENIPKWSARAPSHCRILMDQVVQRAYDHWWGAQARAAEPDNPLDACIPTPDEKAKNYNRELKVFEVLDAQRDLVKAIEKILGLTKNSGCAQTPRHEKSPLGCRFEGLFSVWGTRLLGLYDDRVQTIVGVVGPGDLLAVPLIGLTAHQGRRVVDLVHDAVGDLDALQDTAGHLLRHAVLGLSVDGDRVGVVPPR